ncbi:MAG: family 20 glycosylhydrolase [Rikenellaceae bacterium]|nr:family 20 glycosylhydrolase [Rikenellaceae bacterium]
MMIKSIIAICMVSLAVMSCKRHTFESNPTDIIPMPHDVVILKGDRYTITDKCRVGYSAGDSVSAVAADMMSRMLSTATGLPLNSHAGFADGGINIYPFKALKGAAQPCDSIDMSETYRIEITSDAVSVYCDTYSGAFYALQTIMQMLPPECYSPAGGGRSSYTLPGCVINDRPAFRWRGMHMDVSRHFFPKDFVLKFIDIMAMHKMNTLHWHLTDDQGWRLEIKKYPRLTQIGAWNVDRTDRPWSEGVPMQSGEEATYGGFYTQQEARQVVAYAAERGITVVPEIEMPGHSWEVIASYPEVSCSGRPQPVLSGGGYKGGTSTLCAGKEQTFKMMQDILDEVIDIFPSEYIHIGGDEADKTPWKSCPDCRRRMTKEHLADVNQLQSYFVKRIERYVRSKGRKIIGWDEIIEGGIAPEANVMSWRGMAGGIEAASQGHDVVMTPGEYLYFDSYQDTPGCEPTAIGGFSPVSKVYRFDPIPEAFKSDSTAMLRRHILGAQACTWAEYILTPDHFEYMTVPRIAALSEVLWDGADRLGKWDDFSRRLYTLQTQRYDAMGINYHPGAGYVRFEPEYSSADKCFRVRLLSDVYGSQIAYTTDGSDPDITSRRYSHDIRVNKPVTIKAVVLRGDSIYSKMPTSLTLGVHKGLGKKVTYNSPYGKQFPGSGDTALNDGITGTTDLNDGFNQGFANKDLDIVFDLGQKTSFTTVTGSFTQSIGAWVYLPEALSVYTSDDGKNFRFAAKADNPFDRDNQVIRKQITVTGDFNARYVKVIATNPITPKGLPGEGYKNWIFADEIFIL